MQQIDKTVSDLLENTVGTALDYWLHALADADATGDTALREQIRTSLKGFAPKVVALCLLADVPL